MKRQQIAVVGWAGQNEYPNFKIPIKTFKAAKEVGRLLAIKNCITVTGGKGGVMEAASKGAKENNGLTVGIISGKRKNSNNFIDVEVLSGAAFSGLDEFLLISMSDAIIVIGGGAGTLQEIAIAYRQDVPIIVLDKCNGWGQKVANTYLDVRKKRKIFPAETPFQAVERAIYSAQKAHNPNSF